MTLEIVVNVLANSANNDGDIVQRGAMLYICLGSKFRSEVTRYLHTTGEMLGRLEKTLFCF